MQDKQQLCVEASKAMEMLDDQQRKEHQKHSMMIDELNQKIESMTVSSQQQIPLKLHYFIPSFIILA